MKSNRLFTVLIVLLAADILLRLGASQPSASAQTKTIDKPHLVNLTAATTDNGNQLLYRLWSNGDIDVRLANPLRTQANDWPNGTKAGLSFQEGWKLMYKGE